MTVRWFLFAMLAACGPVTYIDQVTMNASTAVAAAKTAEAEKYAPYWWTLATEYLHEARERAAVADFQGANRFGKLATEAAVQAVTDSEAARTNPDLLPIDVKSQPAPAKDAPAKGDLAPAKESRE